MPAVLVDPSAFESADNETNATTYYGGSIVVGEQTIFATGTDRDSVNVYDDVISAIFTVLGLSLDDFDTNSDEYHKVYEEFMLAVDNLAPFTVVLDGTTLTLGGETKVELPKRLDS